MRYQQQNQQNQHQQQQQQKVVGIGQRLKAVSGPPTSGGLGSSFGEDHEDDDGGNPTGTFMTGMADPMASSSRQDRGTRGSDTRGQNQGRTKGTTATAAGAAAATVAELEKTLFAGYHGSSGNKALPSAYSGGGRDALLDEAKEKKVASDPAKLRGALTALRGALKKPLSSHAESFLRHDAPPASADSLKTKREGEGSLGGDRRLDRPTAAALARQQPRRTYQAPPLPPELGGGTMGVGRGVRADQGAAAAVSRKDEAAKMMASIEADLDAIMEQRHEEHGLAEERQAAVDLELQFGGDGGNSTSGGGGGGDFGLTPPPGSMSW
jgi:hypothetical protein